MTMSTNDSQRFDVRTGARRFLIDLAVIAAWIALATVVFRAAGWSVTLYYAVVFAGVIAYSLAFEPWTWRDERDGRSDDGGE